MTVRGEMSEAWACYVLMPPVGWVVDTGVGGLYSFDVSQCKEWPSEAEMRAELEGCDLLDATTGPMIMRYQSVRVK